MYESRLSLTVINDGTETAETLTIFSNTWPAALEDILANDIIVVPSYTGETATERAEWIKSTFNYILTRGSIANDPASGEHLLSRKDYVLYVEYLSYWQQFITLQEEIERLLPLVINQRRADSFRGDLHDAGQNIDINELQARAVRDLEKLLKSIENELEDQAL